MLLLNKVLFKREGWNRSMTVSLLGWVQHAKKDILIRREEEERALIVQYN